MKYTPAILLVLLISIIIFGAPPQVQAAVSDEQAIRAIVGEASGESYQTMLGVACAIRNRGTLQGVYGLKAKHSNNEPAWVWAKARKAWAESKSKDITLGATHFDCVKKGEPYWASTMRKTVLIGVTQFYRS